ncbi:unnamed protein product [Nippostrongylus brasiliensis]|uniref:Putative methyltransferase KIAA1456 (inferred by orthology to a human protein) n=1 Tax=Nippostrongylus brasiliensis TaxID=27835 RepID=A0A0N4YTH2_NIPBR|nr:unnamed protein product [Nippostrongylus brasiliensis]
MSSSLENEYVHSVYSRLATYQKKDHRPSSPRIWPNVRKFLGAQAPGATVIDVVLVLGVDTCAEALVGRSLGAPNELDLLLADAVSLPFRNDTADAVLNVSVLHHLSTLPRRKAVLEECGRCLRPGGQMLIYVWAYEQPNGEFPSQDLLVPWSLSEIPINGRLPRVKFHKNSTKEQRVIQASIPINVSEEEKPAPCTSNWFGSLLEKLQSLRPQIGATKDASTSRTPPPAAPKFLPNVKHSLITGVKRWSPMLGD